MEFTTKPVTSTQQSLGEQVEQWLEFPESQDQVPADQARVLSVISAEREECSLP